MFHGLSQSMRERMAYLEAIDVRDREDGTPVPHRMRQIPPETGRFIALLAAGAPRGKLIEVGTSAGYSGMWLSLACQERGDVLTTFDISEYKAGLARETFELAGVEEYVQVICGDALQLLPDYQEIAFCFMDAEKDLYEPVYEIVAPKLVPGGLFVADNVISHGAELASFLALVQADEHIDALVVPIGKGVLVSRKVPDKSGAETADGP